ncbi:MAG: YlbF family regulator [Clostridia bacterium]|nr:YlbF family regulator [Clostridia bacterium]
MSDVMEKARELGEAIVASEEMKKFKEAELLQSQDEEAATLMQEYNITRMNLARDMQNGKLERTEAIKKNTEAFEEMVKKSETIQNYVDRKREFDLLVQKMNQMLNYYITGQDPNCTHDCSTCGGCH